MTVLAIAAGAIPVPLVPDRAIARVRGAVAHDVLARHGLSLTSDARSVLAHPDAKTTARLMLRKAAEILASRLLRRLGPLAALGTLARGLEVYALGLLLDRYVRQVRVKGPVRVHVEEARKVRAAIDRALVRSLSPSLSPSTALLPQPAEDLRDEFTRTLDAILLTGAALPGYLERRLETAFDEVVASMPELRGE